MPPALLIVVENVSLVFFSSRGRHTRYWRDWSSDVCSSDLVTLALQFLIDLLRLTEGFLVQRQGERVIARAELLEPFGEGARQIFGGELPGFEAGVQFGKRGEEGVGADGGHACSSGLELEGRLGGHGDWGSGERGGVRLQAVAGSLQIVVWSGGGRGSGLGLLRGHGGGGYQHGSQFAAGQLHVSPRRGQGVAVAGECLQRGLLHDGARRGFAGPDFELAHGLFDEHVQARNDGFALLPGVLDEHGFERVVHHVENDVGGDPVFEETLVDVWEHAERGGVNHGVEVVGNELLLEERFGAADLAEGADAVGIAAHQGNLGAGVGKRASRATGGAAVADDQHAGVGDFEQAGERAGDAGGVGIGAAPLAGLAPDGVDGADAARQRFHHGQGADDLLLVGDGDAATGEGKFGGQREKIAQACRGDQKRQIDGIHAFGLKCAVVHGGRYGVAYRVCNHAVDLGGFAQLFDAIEMAQEARTHLTDGSAFGVHGGGIGINAAEYRREHARWKPEFAHGQDDQAVLGQRFGGGEDAQIVAGLAGRGDDLISIRLHLHDPVDHRVHGGRGFKIVIGDDDVGAAAELAQTVLRHLGGFDLDIDGVRAIAHGQVKHRKLFLNAAVEFAVVLVAPAGGQEDAIRVLFEELWDGLRAFTGTAQVIQAEFKKNLAGLGFAAGVLQQCWNVWQAQRDAYAGERPGLRHWIVGNSRITRVRRGSAQLSGTDDRFVSSVNRPCFSEG